MPKARCAVSSRLKGGEQEDSLMPELVRSLRLEPFAPNQCGGEGPGCGGVADAFGDHAFACTRTGLLARRATLFFFSFFSACSSQSNPSKSHSGETGGKLRARRPAGVGRHVALGRRAGIHGQRAVDGQLAEAARERGLGRNREHLPPPARVRGRDRAPRCAAGLARATGELLQESLRLLSPAAANFCSESDEVATPRPFGTRGKWRDACARSPPVRRGQAQSQPVGGCCRHAGGGSQV